MSTEQSFNQNLDAFKEYQSTLRGQLRYNLALSHLQQHINRQSQSLSILDAGGGNGVESIVFAEQGHQVSLVDYSAEMLKQAQHNAQLKGVEQSIEFYQAEVTAVSTLFPEPRFDLVLCHNVLEYVDSWEITIQNLGNTLKPKGLISIIFANRYAESYRLALQEQNLKAAYTQLGVREIANKIFKVPRKAYVIEEICQLLEQAKFSIVGKYGMRCIHDYMPNQEMKLEQEYVTDMERLEQAMSVTFPYYLLARFNHVIAQKS